ncbi:MAG: M36 family metallopeptidase [Archangium sp.]
MKRQLLIASCVTTVLFVLGCEVASSNSASEHVSTTDALWNEAKGRPQLLSGNLFSGEGDAETTARAFLASRANEFHLDRPGLSLTLPVTREGLAGRYLRFAQQQKVGDETLPVFGGEVIVLVTDVGDRRLVRAVNFEHFDGADAARNEGDLGMSSALERALVLVNAQRSELSAEPMATRGVYVNEQGVARLAWRIGLPMEEASPPHDWSVFVDAANGSELGRRDGVHFQASVTGTGYVYDMNPVASTGDLTLTDMNDQATFALNGSRFLVPLPRLDGSGFTRGAYADTRTRDAGGRAFSMSNDFQFTRNDRGFEQTNAYYHLDRAQIRIQELGFMNVNNRVQGVTVDAQTADNSFYTSSSTRLSFGTGGVDDAEDGEIVLHEYGHSIQDNQVPNFGGGDEGAMGEGFGDYLAGAMSQVLPADAGHPQMTDPACVGDWDGTAYSMLTPKCLRRLDSSKHWPEAEAGEVHDDGELWSAGLWRVRTQLGGDVGDRLAIEVHFLLGTSSTFFTASTALLTADQMINAGANEATIRRTMIKSGLSRLLTTPAPMGAVTSLPVSIGPVRDAQGNYRNNTDEVRTVTIPGATGLIVHFTRIDLETNNQCVNNGCDNIYLTNGDGDLFQFLSGASMNTTSNAIVGDTVNIRLVSDNSQVRFGYQVDRIDVLGAPPDASVIFDGGMDTFDAGRPDAGRPDSGMPQQDAGPVPPLPDAGDPPVGDGGVADAGRPDSGIPPASDGGQRPTFTAKLGVESLSPAVTRGCGCTSGAELLAGLMLLGLLRRRR